MMNIPIEANASIADARTIISGDGALIEYNPKQARERVRFSIAHELAHLLFPDASEHVRNRGGTPDISDDWQLELLCNLAASEFVMPMGSLPTNVCVPSIEELMVERRKFDCVGRGIPYSSGKDGNSTGSNAMCISGIEKSQRTVLSCGLFRAIPHSALKYPLLEAVCRLIALFIAVRPSDTPTMRTRIGLMTKATKLSALVYRVIPEVICRALWDS